MIKIENVRISQAIPNMYESTSVHLSILAPLYWWSEFNNYHAHIISGTLKDDISRKVITVDDFSHEYLDDGAHPSCAISMSMLSTIAEFLNMNCSLLASSRNDFYWKQICQTLPWSYNQRRIVTLDADILKHLYATREKNTLIEWVDFYKFLDQLPYIKLITEEK